MRGQFELGGVFCVVVVKKKSNSDPSFFWRVGGVVVVVEVVGGGVEGLFGRNYKVSKKQAARISNSSTPAA